MIRIELKPRSSFHRRLGIVAGLAVAAAAFGAALYTLDRQVPLRSMWGHAAESAASSDAPLETPMDDGVRQVMEPPDLPSSSDAALRSLSLLVRLPAAMKVTTLTAGAGGDFVIEGNLAGSLVEALDSLHPYTIDVRGTSWTSGPQGVAPAACRIVGEVAVSVGTPLQPVPATKAARLFEQVGERAVASGLPAVQSGPARVEAAGSGLSVHHLELRAEGPSTPLHRFVQDLADLGAAVRIAHLVVVRSPDDDAYSQVTLSLEAVVRESPPGGSP
jgi:hypothetical protein